MENLNLNQVLAITPYMNASGPAIVFPYTGKAKKAIDGYKTGDPIKYRMNGTNYEYYVKGTTRVISHPKAVFLSAVIPAPAATAPAAKAPLTATAPKVVVAPAPTVVAVDAKNFYVTGPKVQGVKSMNYKVAVIIDTAQKNVVAGKTYYRILRLKGNGGWESRVNKGDKLPKYWVLTGDYTVSSDQSKVKDLPTPSTSATNTMFPFHGKVIAAFHGYKPGDTILYRFNQKAGAYEFYDKSTTNLSSVKDKDKKTYFSDEGDGQDYAPDDQQQDQPPVDDQQVQDQMAQDQAVIDQMQYQAAVNNGVQPPLVNGGVPPQYQQQQQYQAPQTTSTGATPVIAPATQILGQISQRNTGGVAQQDGLAQNQVVSVQGVNGEFFNNGINTQPYTLLIDTYYPVKMSDGTMQNVPLPKGSTIWADAPFDYNNIAPEHKGSFPDPTDANNQFQRYSWASVDGVTVGGGLIPMRKDGIEIDNVGGNTTLSDVGTIKMTAPNAPKLSVAPPSSLFGSFKDEAAKAKPGEANGAEIKHGMATWQKVAIGAVVLSLVAGGGYFVYTKYFKKAGK